MPENISAKILEAVREIHGEAETFDEKRAVFKVSAGNDHSVHFDSRVFPVVKENFLIHRGCPCTEKVFKRMRLRPDTLVFFEMTEAEAMGIVYILITLKPKMGSS